MKSYHHYNFNFNKYLHKDLTKLELSVWLHSTGRGLIAVFIPIIMLIAGFSLTQVLIIWCLFCLIDAPLNLLARKMVLKIGAKNTIIIGIISEILYFIILYFAGLDWTSSIALAVTAAIYDSFYWTAHWFVFNECVEVKKGVGKQIGFLEIFRQAGTLFAPIIGALFLMFASKNYLILLSLLFLILSLLPLAKIKLDYLEPKSSQSIKQFFKNKDNQKNFLFIAFYAVHSEILETLLPISIYLTFKSLGYVGVFPMIISIASIIFMYFAGMMVDRTNKYTLLAISGAVLALMWIMMSLTLSLPWIYFIAVIMGFFGYMMAMTLDANTINIAKQTDMLDASTFRNSVHMGTRGLLYLALIFALEVFHAAFITAACAMFAILMMTSIFYRKTFDSAH
jgi:MFS family permease